MAIPENKYFAVDFCYSATGQGNQIHSKNVHPPPRNARITPKARITQPSQLVSDPKIRLPPQIINPIPINERIKLPRQPQRNVRSVKSSPESNHIITAFSKKVESERRK